MKVRLVAGKFSVQLRDGTRVLPGEVVDLGSTPPDDALQLLGDMLEEELPGEPLAEVAPSGEEQAVGGE